MPKYTYISKTAIKKAIANVRWAVRTGKVPKAEEKDIIKHLIWEYEYQCPYSPRFSKEREKGRKKFHWK